MIQFALFASNYESSHEESFGKVLNNEYMSLLWLYS
jgi:hypothetical protein